MSKFSKEDFLIALEKNKSYQRALGTVNKEQQDKIKNILDAFIGNAVEHMAPIIERLNKDPELVKQVREHIHKDESSFKDVITKQESNDSDVKDD